MTFTITATAGQVTHLDDGRIVIAKPPFTIVGGITIPHLPPDDLVAVTEPCEGCDGTGWLKPPGDDHGGQVCLLLCHAGRPLFDLEVECDTGCDPIGSGPCSKCATYPHGPGGPHQNTGYIIHAGLYVPGPLLPVVGKDFRSAAPDQYIYVLGADRRSWLFNHGQENPIALPADAVPGRSAVIAERSET